MAVPGDVSFPHDAASAKLHPYLVALVRWCVSYFWSTATVFLHRLVTSQLPAIAGSAAKPPSRGAGRDHLHPEPRVDCTVLHEPRTHELDVVFVHGLYGSLFNTWRQGEWGSKYHSSPEIVHLRRPDEAPIPCNCNKCTENTENNNKSDVNSINNSANENNEVTKVANENINDFNNADVFTSLNNDFNVTKINDDYESNAFTSIDDQFYSDITKILPKDDSFTTEKFYNNTLLDQVEIIENYDTQAKFVSDLFKHCDEDCDSGNYSSDENEFIEENKNNIEQNVNNINCCKNNNDKNMNKKHYYECKCNGKCEVGCGCICDDCYSFCWPKDWIKVDYPNARVISINYTSDPHLWRPLWIKENKRLCLHERAEQMTQQLLELGVGRRPVVWVGHSKGGLFIKQIYCEAYEAFLKSNAPDNQHDNEQKDTTNTTANNITSIIENANNKDANVDKNEAENIDTINNNAIGLRTENNTLNSSDYIGTAPRTRSEASLWSNSIGFMFYSVPHRGSPLADIKTPVTARSVELVEISKDNSLVLSLQERWRVARVAAGALIEPIGAKTEPVGERREPMGARIEPIGTETQPVGALNEPDVAKKEQTSITEPVGDQREPMGAQRGPLVRSLVETRRTLMSVLWLRIVSADSADPGTGALCGVSVDHREICKPSSRRCRLYTELTTLIQVALARYKSRQL